MRDIPNWLLLFPTDFRNKKCILLDFGKVHYTKSKYCLGYVDLSEDKDIHHIYHNLYYILNQCLSLKFQYILIPDMFSKEIYLEKVFLEKLSLFGYQKIILPDIAENQLIIST